MVENAFLLFPANEAEPNLRLHRLQITGENELAGSLAISLQHILHHKHVAAGRFTGRNFPPF